MDYIYIAGIVGRHDRGHRDPNTYSDLDHVENRLEQGGKEPLMDDDQHSPGKPCQIYIACRVHY